MRREFENMYFIKTESVSTKMSQGSYSKRFIFGSRQEMYKKSLEYLTI